MKGFHLNSNGTTKHQKKLQVVAINDLVVSVNEVTDGTASSIIADISRELQTLRDTAHALGMQNPNSINWTMIVSSSSHSAATQKKMNMLVEECKDADEE